MAKTVQVGDAFGYNVDKNTGEVIELPRLGHNDCPYEKRMEDIQAVEEAKEREIKELKASPFDDFAQMNLKHTKDWIALSRKNHTAAEILWFLISKADRYNAIVCSNQVLEEALGCSRITIWRAVNLLKECNFIDIKKSGTTNVYLINKDIAWKSWGKNYKYAEFGAKVLIAESEQEEIKVKTKKVNMVTIVGSNKKDIEALLRRL